MFTTLSPLSGFNSWLSRHVDGGDKFLLNANEHKVIKIIGGALDGVNDELVALLKYANLLDSPGVRSNKRRPDAACRQILGPGKAWGGWVARSRSRRTLSFKQWGKKYSAFTGRAIVQQKTSSNLWA